MKRKQLYFESENEMGFWCGIYQTCCKDSTPAIACEPWQEQDGGNNPAEQADTAVLELRRRMAKLMGLPTEDGPRYHNSPGFNPSTDVPPSSGDR